MDHIAEHFPSHLDPHEEDYEGYPHHLSMADAQELADSYCVEKLTMAEAAESGGISLSSFKSFRRAHTLRKGKAVIVDETKSIEDSIEHFSEEAKRREIDRKARRKHRREMESAAENWWQLEEALEGATEAFRDEEYEPPQLSLTLSDTPEQHAAALYNSQDFHIGARPAKSADSFSVSGYCDGLMEKTENALEDAVRLRKLERFYLVVGGDLVHSDTAKGTTTQGTQLDMACQPTEALRQAIELMVRVTDLARSVASEVVLVPVRGNHDRTMSCAAAMALAQRYHSTDDVRSLSIEERQYLTYHEHLICATHGDYSRKTMKKMGDIIRSEARSELGSTSFTSLATGHLHHRSRNVDDKSGRVHYQAPSPVPVDAWHSKNAFVGSRRGVQLVLFDRARGGDRLIHA